MYFKLPFRLNSKEAEVAVSKKAMELCEEIINEMGAELHDDLVQKLSVLRFQLDKMERSSFDPQETQEIVVKMQKDFRGVVEAVRRISRRLHPVKMSGDNFNKCVELLSQNIDNPGTVKVNLEIFGEVSDLKPMTESYLLRMIQELLHNAIRHSCAWHIWIRLKWSINMLVIEVEDDGTGFSTIKESIQSLKHKHNTLRMRAQAIEASISYEEGDNGLIAIIVVRF